MHKDRQFFATICKTAPWSSSGARVNGIQHPGIGSFKDPTWNLNRCQTAKFPVVEMRGVDFQSWSMCVNRATWGVRRVHLNSAPSAGPTKPGFEMFRLEFRTSFYHIFPIEIDIWGCPFLDPDFSSLSWGLAGHWQLGAASWTAALDVSWNCRETAPRWNLPVANYTQIVLWREWSLWTSQLGCGVCGVVKLWELHQLEQECDRTDGFVWK